MDTLLRTREAIQSRDAQRRVKPQGNWNHRPGLISETHQHIGDKEEGAALRARATVQPSDDAWNLLNRLAKVYAGPDTEFPAPKGPGYVVRYSIERIGGVGPWAPPASR